jgi:hypothetical protein
MNYPYQKLEEPDTLCLHQAMIEAEQRGYDSVVQMWEADWKRKKDKEWEEVRQMMEELSSIPAKKKQKNE